MPEHPTAGDEHAPADRDKELDDLETETVEDLEVDQDAEDVEGGRFPTMFCPSMLLTSCDRLC